MKQEFYPNAIQTPLSEDHYLPADAAYPKSLIVLHVTQGPSASSAFNTFAASKKPNRTSVHFVIDRDGTIYQHVPIRATAWHASKVNSKAVGIEHAAMTDGTLPITPEQLESSAKLVAWLAQELGISLDRNHVMSHNEASPQDKHVLCCAPTLDPDQVVKLALDRPGKV